MLKCTSLRLVVALLTAKYGTEDLKYSMMRSKRIPRKLAYGALQYALHLMSIFPFEVKTRSFLLTIGKYTLYLARQ